MPTVPDIHRRGTRAAQATIASPPLTVGTLYFVTDEGVTERWDGAAWELYSGAGTGTPPPTPPGASPTTWLVSGGQVVWESAYTFRVSAADYFINGTRYASAEDTVALSAADATLDRIDVIALDTLGAVVVIAGTLSATPSEPSVDPAQYLKLALVLVAHATVAPPDVVNVTVYAENVGTPTEWAWASSGASIVVSSTSTPHVGTKTIEGTNVVAGVYAQGTGVSPIDPTDYDQLILFIRSKAAWNSSRGLLVTLRLAGVLVGAAVQIRRSGTFGFDSTVTSDYQLVAIPIVAFAVPQGVSIDQVRLEDFGGAIGFYVDDITFQAQATTPVGGGLTQDQADARYAPLVHAARHQTGGADAIALDTLAAPTDVTTLNASAGAHGLLRKLSGTATDYLDGSGAWSTPAGGGSGISQLTADVTAGPGSGSQAATLAATYKQATVGATLFTAGDVRYVEVPFAMTITAWRIIGDAVSGAAVVDVWKDTFANFPPTVADTIAGSEKPTLAAAQKAEDTTLTTWTTAVTAGDWLAFKLDSLTTHTVVTVQLTGTRS